MLEFIAYYRTPKHGARHVLEMAALLALLWAPARAVGAEPGELAPFLALAMGLAALSRMIERPPRLALAATLWVFGTLTLLYLIEQNTLFSRAAGGRKGGEIGAFQILAPFWIVGWRRLARLLIPLLVGLGAARGRFRYRKFIGGFAPAAALLLAAFHPELWERFNAPYAGQIPGFFLPPEAGLGAFQHGRALLLESVADLLACMAALILPLQREALDRAFGLRAPAAAQPAEGMGVAGAAFALLLASAAGFFAVYGGYERALFARAIERGPETRPLPPGARNAGDILAPIIDSERSPRLDCVASDGAAFSAATARKILTIRFDCPFSPSQLEGPLPPELLDRALGMAKMDEIEKAFQALAPYFEAMEKLKQADGFRPSARGMRYPLNLGNLVEASRMLGLRALLRAWRGELAEARTDIETIARTAWLVRDTRTVSGAVTASAIREGALRVAYAYWARRRRDPEALRDLAELLSRDRWMLRAVFDPEELRENEPTLWPIVPYGEIYLSLAGPDWDRIRSTVLRRSALYDELRLAIALDRFRAERGRYPDALDELGPEFIDAPPLDPFDGKPYAYVNLGDDFSLETGALMRARRRWEDAALMGAQRRWEDVALMRARIRRNVALGQNWGFPFPPSEAAKSEDAESLLRQIEDREKAAAAANGSPAPKR